MRAFGRLGNAPGAMALRLDDPAPAHFEQPLDQGFVQVAVRERGLDRDR
jgi:hypothetical protein